MEKHMKILNYSILVLIILCNISGKIFAAHQADEFVTFAKNFKVFINILDFDPHIPVGIIKEFTEVFTRTDQTCSCVLDTHGGEQPEEICDIILRLQKSMSGELFNNAFLFCGP